MENQVNIPAESRSSGGFIYVACPWTHVGGGMFKVADYLIQAQSPDIRASAAELRPLDTRGSGRASYSAWVLTTALAKLVRGRLGGQLRGVHINMAERLSLIRKSVVVVTCRLLGVPVVLHLHAAQLHHAYRRMASPMQAVIRWIFSLPTCVVVLGQSAHKFVTEDLGVPPSKVEIVINGVPGPSAARRVNAAGSTKRLFFLGSDWERKGLFDLLKALAHPDFERDGVELVVAGRGDIEACRKRATDLGVAGLVRFEGWADQQKAARLLAETDALVLPSYDEGLPLVILEALGNGVAVVCTPVGEIPTVLTDGVDVCFVQPGDIAGIAAGLNKVLGDPGYRALLERNGRALYEQQFSLGRFFTRVAEIHRKHFGTSAALREGSLP